MEIKIDLYCQASHIAEWILVFHQNGILAAFMIINIEQQISADTNNPSDKDKNQISTFRTYFLLFSTYTNNFTGNSLIVIHKFWQLIYIF